MKIRRNRAELSAFLLAVAAAPYQAYTVPVGTVSVNSSVRLIIQSILITATGTAIFHITE